jgi:multidrug resistance efflux pump
MSQRPEQKRTGAGGDQRSRRVRRRRLLTWRRLLLVCLLMPVAIVVATTLVESSRWVHATGYVMTDQEAELRPSVQGVIAESLVQSGDLVEKGQPIIRLNDRVETAACEQAGADLQAKQAQLEQLLRTQALQKAQRKEQIYQAQRGLSLAEGNLKRVTQGDKRRAVFSRREIEEAHLNVELARSRVRELQLDRDSAMASQSNVLKRQIDSATKNFMLRKAHLDLRLISSPMRGTIQLNGFALGEVIGPQDVLGQVFDHGRWIIKLKISERWIRYVKPGQEVDVSLAAYPSLRFGYLPAKITRVLHVVAPQPSGDGVFYAEATVREPNDFDLDPGMIASANINTGNTTWFYRLLGW